MAAPFAPAPAALARAALGLVAVILVTVSCGSAAATGAPGSSGGAGLTGGLSVAAAASLRVAATRLAAAFEASRPGVTITVATDSSAALRTQIEQGAPFDVFLSADVANPIDLAKAGLIAGDPIPFTANTVALVVPADDPAGIASPADLARPGLRLVAAGANVPITAYADQVIANLGSLAGYPAGYAAAVRANTVSREDNVAAVLAKVELGEGDAGFVYATDAAGSTKVRAIEIPGDANVRAEYAGVVVKASAHMDLAAAFLSWVAGPAGQAILRPLGFQAP